MVISVDINATDPAEILKTTWACYLIAAFIFNDCIITRWARFCTLLNIHFAELFRHISKLVGQIILNSFLFLLKVLVRPNFWALFKEMILLFTVKAKYKAALLTSSIVFSLIYLCRLGTLLNGTPSKILHAIYGTVNTIFIEFLNYFLR